MKRRRIKFVWGAGGIKAHWFFGLVGLYDRKEGMREDGLAVNLRGVMAWGLVLSVAGYFAAAAALFAFWQRSPYCLLTYSDALCYPVRRPEIAAKKGQAFIAEGQELIKANKWFDGARLLRQGLSLYPNDLPARLALGKFYTLINQRVLAVRTLTEVMPREFPGRTYLHGVLDVAEQSEDFDLVVSLADRYLAVLKPEAEVERRWLATRKFGALLAAQRGVDALAFAESEPPGDLSGEHRVLALLELKRAAEAVDFLVAWEKRPGADLGAVRRLQVRALREAGRRDEMEKVIERLRALSPDDTRLAVYAVIQRAMGGETDPRKAGVEDYIFRFGGNAQNLEILAAPLVEVNQRALFERTMAVAKDHGFSMYNFHVLQAQLHAQRGEWVEATRALGLLKPPPGVTLPLMQRIWTEWMQKLMGAASVPADAAQLALLEYLRGRPWPFKLFRQAIETLIRAERWDTAREAIATAQGIFPASRWVRQQKELVAAQAPAPAPATPRAADRPAVTLVGATLPRATPTDVLVPLAEVTEEVYFEQLDTLVRERQWDGVDRLIREARTRRPPPDWITRRDGDIRLAEIRLSQARGELPAMRAAAMLYLTSDVPRARKAVEVAQEFFSVGDQPAAVALIQVVLQRTPEFAQAKRLLAEWTGSAKDKK